MITNIIKFLNNIVVVETKFSVSSGLVLGVVWLLISH